MLNTLDTLNSQSEEHPVGFYSITDDIPVGGFAKLGNEIYKVVKSNYCWGCDAFDKDDNDCYSIKCSPCDNRLDGNTVAFILYDTIPEDATGAPYEA